MTHAYTQFNLQFQWFLGASKGHLYTQARFETPRGPGRSVPLNIVVEFRLLSSQDLYLIICLGKKVVATARFFYGKAFLSMFF